MQFLTLNMFFESCKNVDVAVIYMRAGSECQMVFLQFINNFQKDYTKQKKLKFITSFENVYSKPM